MDFKTFSTDNREVEFILKNGMKTGLFLTLCYESKGSVQDANKNYKRRLQDEMKKGRNANLTNLSEQYDDNRVCAHVTGWRWAENSALTFNDGRPEYEERILREMLNSGELGVLLREFVEDEVRDAAAFMPKSRSA